MSPALDCIRKLREEDAAILTLLETGKLVTGGRVYGDGTEECKALYRSRVAEFDDLIGRMERSDIEGS